MEARLAIVATIVTALLVFTPLGPVASAGTEQAPEITDPTGDTQPASASAYADVVAGWITDDATKITTYVKVAQLPPNTPPNMLYIFGFAHHHGTCHSFYTYFWVNGQTNAPEFKQGVFDDCADQPLNNSEKATTGVAGTQGSPIFKVEFQKKELGPYFKGDALTNLSALVIDGTAFTAFAACAAGDAACQAAGAVANQASAQAGFPDGSSTEKTYTLSAGPARPEPVVVEDGNDTMGMGGDGDPSNGDGSGDDGNLSGDEQSRNTPGFEVAVALVATSAAFAFRRRK
ncbi:MAG: hypothetical protein HY556_05590 [Euryarchaeota archaeon]|nr:hypothetical protein [Euryarchaeota archaeon]